MGFIFMRGTFKDPSFEYNCKAPPLTLCEGPPIWLNILRILQETSKVIWVEKSKTDSNSEHNHSAKYFDISCHIGDCEMNKY